jgi:mycothiol synthase
MDSGRQARNRFVRTSHSEQPQLKMAWPAVTDRTPIDTRVPRDYLIRTYRPGDEPAFLDLMALMDFDPWSPQKLEYNLGRILPDGWFFALDARTTEIIATAMSLHNYSGDSPFTGDLGWLACHPEHRGRGLGYSLAALVTNRFLTAGYTRIQLRTEYYRLPAIKTYLKLGYRPVMYCKEAQEQWREVCRQVGWPYTPDRWPDRSRTPFQGT